ncbi:Obg-like ATPase 1 [Rhizoclosmatium globosum]|uniref:Obg-like ATPase 1 n=1 Tax=Rhizoclosmatium globosum TaxID=329046 RepID=A0A1Y2C0F7_9FUNG|nr:Obg-like ATPase 1 [Rhizoclosmatium globosum]|eukprot:ORY40512.1 Obg-like ATPase 1 [Rhizoclosmatium globosum]
MPPKKAVGIVGLPNVGKSSFFNALCGASAPSENFPFCTIDPEEARVEVPDDRIDVLYKMYQSSKKVPAYLTCIDIAGLVKGAHEGQGLGNAFLSHIRAVDGIFHLTRAFEDADVIHVEGNVDPVRDLQIIHEELRLKDCELLTKQYESKGKEVSRLGINGDKAKKEEFECIKKIYQWVVEQKKDAREGDWNSKEIEVINSFQLITAKPVVYLCNLSERDFARKKNKWLAKIKAWIDENHPGDVLIPYSGTFENALSQFETEQEKKEYCEKLAAANEVPAVSSILHKIILTGYSALRLMYFFTCGPMEVRCWTIRQGTKAPQAAGVIHTDFENNFIMAEIMKYTDLVELGSEAAVKAAGKYHMKGRDTIILDGDIIHFKAGQAAKKK